MEISPKTNNRGGGEGGGGLEQLGGGIKNDNFFLVPIFFGTKNYPNIRAMMLSP